jgi:D-alanine-D-alanine ligase
MPETDKKIRVAVVFNDYFSGIDPNTGAKIRINNADLSEASYDAGIRVIEKSLMNKGFEIIPFGLEHDLNTLINFLQNEKPDVVFNLCESFNNESTNEMFIAGLYELVKVSYTGASAFSLGLLIQKNFVKEILKANSFSTPEFLLIKDPANFHFNNELRFPMIIKPSHEDASVGISNNSIVKNETELYNQVTYLFNYLHQPVIVEEYIEGREFNIAVLGDTDPEVLPISEINFSGLPDNYPKIVTYAAKWMDGSPEYLGTKGECPAKLDKQVEDNLKDLAMKVYKLFRCRDYARVDLRMDKNNVPYILEINPNPDLSLDAGFFRSSRTAGFSYEDMLEKIVMFAYKRKR